MLEDLEELGPRLSTDDAAAFLSRSSSTLARWRDEGEGPKYLKIGSNYLYPTKWLIEYLRSTVVVPSGEKPE